MLSSSPVGRPPATIKGRDAIIKGRSDPLQPECAGLWVHLQSQVALRLRRWQRQWRRWHWRRRWWRAVTVAAAVAVMTAVAVAVVAELAVAVAMDGAC